MWGVTYFSSLLQGESVVFFEPSALHKNYLEKSENDVLAKKIIVILYFENNESLASFL